MINGNMVGGTAPIKTLTIVDSDGLEMTGVVVDSHVVFTANAATDIREGKVAATDAGVVTGTKVIPSYHTSEGFRVIPSGTEYYIPFYDNFGYYDYTKLQAIICAFNTSLENSVSSEKVVLNDNVYEVKTTEVLSVVTKNSAEKKVMLGITNENDKPQILRYFTYKEI